MWTEKVLELLKDELEMTVEGDVMASLGINFMQLPTGVIEMLQLGLTEQVLKTMVIQDCNPGCTPASQKPLGKDNEGPEFVEKLSFSSVVVMLLYLVANSWPEIAYAVHQRA